MATSQNKIGIATATIIGMNAMIGAGIFSAPATLASNVGPAGILAYIFVVVSVWFMAQSIARVAYLFPEEGSFYTYAKQWGGHNFGVLVNTSYLCGLLIAMGLLAQLAGVYLHHFFPTTSPNILGIGALSGLIILNMFGVVLSQLGQHILICCTVFPLLATTIMCLSKTDFSLLTPFAPFGFANVLKATRVVIFGFFGFECAASLFNIVENPKKNVPKALTYSIILIGFLYTFFIGSIILSTPLKYFSSAATPLSEVLNIIFPNNSWIITIIHASILSAILGTIHSMIWASSSLFISFIKLLKNTYAKNVIKKNILNQRTSVLFIGAAITLSYINFKNLNLFFNLTALFIVFAYVSSMVTLLTIKKEWKSGQNIKTLFGIGFAMLPF